MGLKGKKEGQTGVAELRWRNKTDRHCTQQPNRHSYVLDISLLTMFNPTQEQIVQWIQQSAQLLTLFDVREISEEDDQTMTQIEPIPPSLEGQIFKSTLAYSTPTSYFHRLRMYPDSKACVAVDKKTNVPVAVCASGLKSLWIQGKKVNLQYGMAGQAHPDYRNKGALTLAGRGTESYGNWFRSAAGFYGSCTATHSISIHMMQKTGFHRGSSFYLTFPTADFSPNPPSPTGSGKLVTLTKSQSAEIEKIWNQYYLELHPHDFFPAEPLEIISTKYFEDTLVLSSDDGSLASISTWERNDDFPLKCYKGPPKNNTESTAEDFTWFRQIPESYKVLFAPIMHGPRGQELFEYLLQVSSTRASKAGTQYVMLMLDGWMYPPLQQFLSKNPDHVATTEYVQYLSKMPFSSDPKGLDYFNLGTDPKQPTFWDPRDVGPVFLKLVHTPAKL